MTDRRNIIQDAFKRGSRVIRWDPPGIIQYDFEIPIYVGAFKGLSDIDIVEEAKVFFESHGLTVTAAGQLPIHSKECSLALAFGRSHLENMFKTSALGKGAYLEIMEEMKALDVQLFIHEGSLDEIINKLNLR